jgi:hypothetical protein
MKHKKLIIVSSIVAAVIVISGLVGGAVFAATPASSTGTLPNPDKVFADKVATILGLDNATVEDAFTKARTELQTEALDTRLAKLVADGKLTQAQADQYRTWMQSKPNVPGVFGGMESGRGMMGPGFGKMGPGFGCPRGHPGKFGPGPGFPPPPPDNSAATR